MGMRDLGRLLILTGLGVAILGAVLMFAGRTSIGRLPGDLVYRKGNFTLYFPLMTSILLSLILTLIFWIFRR